MNKILTSHVGSLPRSQEVVDFIFARENNKKYDQKSFDECMQRNVLSTVEKQKNSGIDIVSDGETSKISYATYVKDRYTGFSGDSPRNAPEDLKLFPGFLQGPARAELPWQVLMPKEPKRRSRNEKSPFSTPKLSKFSCLLYNVTSERSKIPTMNTTK